MLANVLQAALAEPGVRANMHRLGTGHKSSSIGMRRRYGIPGYKEVYSLPCKGPRYRQRDVLTAMPLARLAPQFKPVW